MENHKPIFGLDVPLAEQHWFRDWDHAASMIDSMKLYWFEHGTVPVWNMHFCGGRPEVALPHSLSFLWYSPILYLMESYTAIIAIWILMTLLGGTAFYFLLHRWTGNRTGALAGTMLYCVSGYYASHYNQGHIWWASHHFFPVILLFFDKAVNQVRPTWRTLLAIGVATWCYFTASLPHGLFYLYPAFILYTATMMIRQLQAEGLAATRKTFTAPLVAHGFGILAALYKLIPVIAWQTSSPRTGVLIESMTPADIIMNSLRFISDYDAMFAQHFSNQTWFAWEYSWYVGLAPWLLLIVVIAAALRTRKGGQMPMPVPHLVFTLTVLTTGFLLAMGNGNPFSPASLFKYLPLVKGIRTFGRYQVLCLFALSIISAYGIAWLRTKVRRPWIFYLFVAATVAPGVAQTTVLVVRIGGVTDAMLDDTYKLPPSPSPGIMAIQGFDIRKGMSYHSYLLRNGYWVLDCYDPMNFKRPVSPDGGPLPITTPPPEKIALTWRGAIFSYPETLTGTVVFNGPVYEGFSTNLPYTVSQDAKWEFRAEDLPGRTLEIQAPVIVERVGFSVSIITAVLGAICLIRREKHRRAHAG